MPSILRKLLLPLTALLGLSALSPDAAAQYATETRTLSVDNQNRNFLLLKPNTPSAQPRPLVIVLHGDGGSSAGIRDSLPIHTSAAGNAVFAYPKSAGGSFEYWTGAGRAHEKRFIERIIQSVNGNPGIDTNRVYLVGYSGGAAMTNALGCLLGRNVIRGVIVNAGGMWSTGQPGDYANGQDGLPNCNMPQALIIWGMNDNVVSYNTSGIPLRNTYTSKHTCQNTTTNIQPNPCVSYNGCAHRVQWCAIPAHGHGIWNNAATTAWNFISSDNTGQNEIFANGFESTNTNPSNPARWVMGYYVGYERNLQAPNQVDFEGITHLMVGRVVPTANGTLTTNFDIDNTNGPIWANQIITRAKQQNRKVILMVGGAGAHQGWQQAAATPALRQTFVTNLLATMNQFNADGLDLDWEPIVVADHEKLLDVARRLRAARPNMLLTMPVNWVSSNAWLQPDPSYIQFLRDIAPSLDRINVMSYEMAGAWPGWQTWFSSALRGHATAHPTSVEASMNYHRNTVGLPAAKLGVGYGFYGHCWRGVSAPRLNQPAGSSFVASDGAMSYRNIVADYQGIMTQNFDNTAQVPWLSSNTAGGVGPQRCNLVTYENPQSVRAKSQYARQQGFGGAIIWTISQGYRPNLSTAAQRNPLLEEIRLHYLN